MSKKPAEGVAEYDGMRLRIIEATLDVVGESGLENLTIRRVSEHAGVSLGIVHHHFENKLNLIYRTFEFLIRRTRERLKEGRRTRIEPVARLKFTADIYFTGELMSKGAANV